MRDDRNLLPIVLILTGFALLFWTLLFGGRGWNFWGNGSSANRATPTDPYSTTTTPSSTTTTTPYSTFNPSTSATASNLCGKDSNGNAAPMLQSTTGSSRVAPVNGLAAARVRSSPGFGQNVVGCIRAGNLVAPTGRVSGSWSEVKLSDNTLGWISSNQLN